MNVSRNVMPWVITLSGFGALGLVAQFAVSPHPLVMEAGGGLKPLWLKSLVGKNISLPAKDAQGYALPIRAERLVVALSCTSCSIGPNALQMARQSPFKPLIIVAPLDFTLVPKEMKGHPEALLIVCDPLAHIAPKPMLETLPQAAIVDESGNIVSVPDASDSLQSFIASGGQS